MAEQEIIKHSKAVYNTLKEPNKGWKHKLADVFAEIIIIVFAVSISIWFHNFSEERHDKKEAREFLIGLKQDIKGDEAHLKSSETFYKNALNGLTYLSQYSADTNAVTADSVRANSELFLSFTSLQPYMSRYEGFKVSGRFKIIENNDLLDNIIQLHEQVFNHINNLTDVYNSNNTNYILPLIAKQAQLNSQGKVTNRQQILGSSEIRLYMNFQRGLIINNILGAYETGITQCEDLIKQIDQELK